MENLTRMEIWRMLMPKLELFSKHIMRKTTGADMALKVEGKAVCSYCRGDIAAAAEKAGLNSLQINEVTTGRTLYWKLWYAVFEGA
ncbi:hypothetical protein P4234_15345 [Pseudomonas aeruginosa]|nr:hypothetical protein [Pseudomonas aeruginosa]